MKELLELLVEGGVDNVNQSLLEASRFGNTELVHLLLQIFSSSFSSKDVIGLIIKRMLCHWRIRMFNGRRQNRYLNNLDIDVYLALEFACEFSKIRTMEYLVTEGNAAEYLRPRIRAADRGVAQIWSCLALAAATSSCQVDVAKYLLENVEGDVLSAFGIDIVKAAGKRGWAI
ncbi:Ankyrin repeat protein [Nymphaea thermarum]|nr:Ankyrin repeat protein [Nymphaea thermarum]